MSLFITFEGGEGTGKTTVINNLYNYLISLGYDVIKTREPGGSKISESIRGIILDRNNTIMDYKTEALMYAASRRQHLIEVIIPALKKNKIVICDRYIDSSLAYQGYARGLGIEQVKTINEYAISGYWPDLTIYIDLDPNIGINRIKNNNRDVDRLDEETISFHEKVREGYIKLIDLYPNRIKKIDGNVSLDILTQIAKEIVVNKLKEG
ncbi:MAG: dTMP kinase [Bacilli bacterium]|nr:dTMP kinase [Bacilli bacterium]MDD2681972.1 dTMP kinase [Bacilli bacterium]MDD3120994.1 dTMP kinase [Bacilli bacterium]MDD4063168.1 dTMP kinase [Bacilli bacterium]MDD4481808.1 dTMP kinase [Bacilli bacterium]